jgi:hypothetical protein
LNPHGRPFTPTLKGEQRDKIVVHWNILLPFLGIGALTACGIVWNLVSSTGPVAWNEFMGGTLALAVYVLALLFFCCLACIDWPKDAREYDRCQTTEGQFLRALRVLMGLPVG